MIFLDCRFDVAVQAAPPPDARVLLESLLAAPDLEHVEVPVSQKS
jgi:hypothetical protein